MQASTQDQNGLDPKILNFYRQALILLKESKVPFLIGGAYAFARYTGIVRHTKDLDIFLHPRDCNRALEALSAAGYKTELTDSVWIGKAFYGDDYVDIIFSSGNGIAEVDDLWFEHAVEEKVLGMPVRLCPVEETIWSKGFVMERDRYDGADVAHLLRACAEDLDWPRLLRRFDPQWRVLFSHLVLFGFIYPSERSRIPNWILQELTSRLQDEMRSAAPKDRVCQGTLLSRTQYLADTELWGYQDARLISKGR